MSPMPEPHHPAIRRGHYESMHTRAFSVEAERLDGGSPLRVEGPMPVLCRVVVPGLDLWPYLEAVPVAELPRDLSSPAFVRLIAPYLREGLIDPGNGRRRRGLAPVIATETLLGLMFVQAIACLN